MSLPSCPNKNLQDWKDLVKLVGEERANYEYVLNNYDIPTIAKIKANPFFGKNEKEIKEEILKQSNAVNGFIGPMAYTIVQKLVNQLTRWNEGKPIYQLLSTTNGSYYLKKVGSISGGSLNLSINDNTNNQIEQVKELFESNPELANSVYEAMGIVPKMINRDNQEYFNNPRIRFFVKIADEVRNSLPKVNEGFTRLYRGNRPSDLKSNPVFTNSLEGIALPFLMTYEGQLSYIDIPTSDLSKYVQKGGVATNAEFIVTPEIAKIATPINNTIVEKYKKQYPDKLVPIEITPQQKKQVQQAYSTYLNTIFPNSKVKDIVYHGSDIKFDGFLEDNLNYFGTKEIAKGYGKNLYPVLIEINKPYYEDGGNLSNQSYEDLYDKLDESNSDGFISNGKNLFVPKSEEQIHLLGSKQDIEGFKKFSQNTNLSINNKTTQSDSFSSTGESDNLIESDLNVESFQSSINNILIPGFNARNQEAVMLFVQSRINKKLINLKEGKPGKWLDYFEEIRHYIREQRNILNDLSQKQNDKYAALVAQFDLIEEQWDKIQSGVISRANSLFKLTLKNEGLDDAELSEMELNESLIYDTYDDTATFRINHKAKLTLQLKQYFSSIDDAKVVYEPVDKDNPNGEQVMTIKPKRNYLGLTATVPYFQVYSAVMDVLQGSRNEWDEIMTRLKNSYEKYPFLSNVVNLLEDAPLSIKNAVQYNMLKHKVNMKMVYHIKNENGNTYNIIDSHSKTAANLLITEWQNVMLTKDFVVKNLENIYQYNTSHPEFVDIINVAESWSKVPPSVNDLSNWLLRLGISVETQTLNQIKQNGLPSKRGVTTYNSLFKGQGLFAMMLQNLKSVSSKDDVQQTSFFTKVKGIHRLSLADVVNKSKIHVDSFRNGEGKMIWGYTNTRYYVDRLFELRQNHNELVNQLLELPYNSTSIFLQGMKNPEYSEQVEYFWADVYRRNNQDNGKTFDRLEEREYELSRLTMFQNRRQPIAHFLYPTLSDKKTVFGLTMPRFSITNQLGKRMAWTNTKGEIGKDTIDFVYQNVVLPEILRILHVQENNVKINNKQFDKGSKLFYHIPSLNEASELFNNDSVYNFDEKNESYEIATLKTDVVLNYSEVIKRHIKQHLQNLVQKKLDDWKAKRITEKDFDNDYLAEIKAITNVNNQPMQYAALDFELNYMLFNVNMFQAMTGDPALYYKSSSLNPITQVIDTYKNMGKRLAADNASGNRLANVENETFNLLNVADRVKKQSDYIETLKNITGTDAQELTTLEEHLYMLVKQGTVSEKQSNEILLAIKEGQTLNAEHLKIVLQPAKPVYVTNIIDPVNKTERRVYVKSSSFPIIPQFVEDTYMKNLLSFMQGNNATGKKYQRVAFESAIKIGAPKALNIWNNDGSIKDLSEVDGTEYELSNLPRTGFKVQQEVPFKDDKTTINDGTQQRQLLFLDVLDLTFNYKRSKKPISGRELHQKMMNVYKEIYDTMYQDFKDRFKIGENDTFDSIKELQSILLTQAKEQNYFINEQLGLMLADNQFVMPLWANSASPKFEALLNSLIQKNIVKLKMPGRSFVLGTEEGFQTRAEFIEYGKLTQSQKSQIVYTDKFDGALKPMRLEDGKVMPAQVLVPFRFKDNFGKNLKLRDFTKDVDGKTILDYSKIPSELLEMFGYRIPTQGHVSMSYIEIVGFLPDVYGDLIIAPREFTKQMGSDFDIDKLYAMMYNYIVEDEYFDVSQGQTVEEAYQRHISKPSWNPKKRRNVVLKDEADFDDKIARVKFARNNDFYYDPKKNKFHDKLKNRKLVKIDFNTKAELEAESEDVQKVYAGVLDSNDPLTDISRGLFRVLNNGWIRTLENRLMDIHKTVMLNPDMYERIVKALDYGQLKDEDNVQASMYHIFENMIPYDYDFSGITSTYQTKKYLSARAAKTAVGAFSSDAVFNFKLQAASDKNRKIRHGNYIMTEAGLEFIETKIKFGDETSNSVSDINTADNQSTKSYEIASWQSAAVDEENQGIFAMLGIVNRHLLPIKAMNQLGFRSKTTVAFISQPAIKDLLNANVPTEESNYLAQKWLGETELKMIADAYRNEDNSLVRLADVGYDELMANLTNRSNLSDSLKRIQQYYIGIKFLELESIGQDLMTVQSAVSLDGGNGLSSSITENIEKEEQIKELLGNKRFLNLEYLLGTPIVQPDGSRTLVPNTLTGFIYQNGLTFNNNLWKDYYPYLKSDFRLMRANIQNEVIAPVTEVFKHYKSAVFTTNIGLYDGNLNSIRQRLLFDKVQTTVVNGQSVPQYHNQSLGTIIEDVKNSAYGKTNPFLQNLYAEYKGIGQPVVIKLHANTIDDDHHDIMLRGFLDLLNSTRQIGVYNEQEYTARYLGEELVRYAYLNSGVQGASQFLKYIPIPYLVSKGIASNLRQFKLDDTIAKRFTRQYIQHHPKETKYVDVNSPEVRVILDYVNIPLILDIAFENSLNQNIAPKFVHTLTNEGTNVRLFERVSLMNGVGRYQQIDTLGYDNGSEYNLTTDDQHSLISKNRSILQIYREQNSNNNVNDSRQLLSENTNTETPQTLQGILEDIFNTTQNPLNKVVAEQMLNNISQIDHVKFVASDTLGSAGAFENSTQTLYYNTTIKNREDYEALMLHELGHAFLNSKLVNPTTKKQKEIVEKINELWTNFKLRVDQDKLEKLILKVAQKREDFKAKQENRKPKNLVSFTKEEMNVIYAATDVKEFVALVISSPELQQELNKVKDNNKSFFSQLYDLLLQLLKDLGFDVNSEFSAAFDSIISLINEVDESNKNSLSVYENVKFDVEGIPFNNIFEAYETLKSGDLDEDYYLGDKKGFGTLSENDNSDSIMQDLVRRQIAQNPEFIEKLRAVDVSTITDDIPQSWKERYVSAISYYFMMYATDLSINATEDEIRSAYGLFSTTGKPTVVDSDIVHIINAKHPNVQAKAIPINKNGKTLGYDIDFTLFEGVPVSDIEKTSVLVRNLKSRKSNLFKQLLQASNAKNEMLAESIRSKIDEVDSTIKTVKENLQVEDLEVYAAKDLAELENVIKDNMSLSDIFYTRKIVHMWMNAIDLFFTPDEKQSKILSEKFREIEGKMRDFKNKLTQIEYAHMNKIVSEHIGQSFDIEQMTLLMSDINRLQLLGMDISRIGNPMFSVIYEKVKTANYEAQNEADEIITKVNNLVPKVLDEIKSLGYKDFDIFLQEYKDGNRTGNLVFRYTQEFYDTKDKLRRKAERSNKAKSWANYITWLNANTITFDVRKLFPTDNTFYKFSQNFAVAEQEAHKNELIRQIGQKGFDHLYGKLQQRMEDFYASYQSYFDSVVENPNRLTLEEQLLLEKWDKENSPYWYSHYTNDRVVPVFGGKTFKPRGYNYTYNAPLRYYSDGTTTNWYDDKFDVIENNEVLYEFYNYMLDVLKNVSRYIPENKKSHLQINTIPEIQRTVLEEYSDKGMKAGIVPLWDSVIKGMRVDDLSQYTNKFYDPETGETEPELKVNYLADPAKDIQSLYLTKIYQYKIQNDYNEPSSDVKDQFMREAKNEVASRKSTDLGKVIKAYAMMSLAYKHKSKIEDVVRLGKAVLDNMQQVEKTADGRTKLTSEGTAIKLPQSESYLKTKEMFDYYYNVFFGKAQKLEGTSKSKVYTKDEKARKKQLEESLKQLETDYKDEKIEAEEYNQLRLGIVEQLDELGGVKVASKIGNNFIKYVQLKSMAWNPFSAISNIGYGYVSNMITANEERDFNKRQIRTAYKWVINSVTKNFTFNKVETKTAKKIRSLMDKFDVLKDMSNDVYQTSKENTINKNVRWLEPFNMQKRGEYINQSTIMIAMMLNTQMQTPNGETVNMWEFFDEDGDVKYGTETEIQDQINKFRMKIDQVIKRVHGNYDTLSPLAVQKTFLGRAGVQFRKWMLEGFANAFEAEKYDYILGYSRKGRYRTALDMLITGKSGESIGENFKYTGKVLLNKVLFGLYKIKDNPNLSEVDNANVKANMGMLVMYLQLLTLALVIKAMAGDDDDEEAKYARNYIINHLTRLQTDISFYVNPNQFEALTVNPIPVASVINDAYQWIDAAGRALRGDDDIKTGIYAGESRLLRETSQLLPLGNSIYRNLSASRTEYK